MKTVTSIRLILTFATVLILSSAAFSQIGRVAISDMQDQIERSGGTFTVSENEATKYPLEQICGMKEPADWKSGANFKSIPSIAASSLPSAFDWRTAAGAPPIRNQGGCGSCWAFATVGALECAIRIREGQSVNLSEQWLLSCNLNGWDCDGGWYAHSYHGLVNDACGGTGAVLETDFPYVGRVTACNCPYPHHYNIKTWAYIGDGGSVAGIEQMKQAIMEYGPISVSIAANSYFQGYHSGVFNMCTNDPINHAVVLMGWDDSQGTDGVWILRNSWGTSWGESGYMKIAYGCCQVGYAACYIDYRPVEVSVTNDFGPAPLTASFQSNTPGETVIGCTWDFGDGETSTEMNPIHLYDQPGCFTVKLTVNTASGNLVKICPNLVSAYADTLAGAAVHLLSGGPVRLDVAARNYLTLNKMIIPFSWSGSWNLRYDSFSVASARTSYFDQASLLSMDVSNKRATIILSAGSQAPLAAGEGTVLSLWFTAPASPAGMNTVPFTDYASYSPEFTSSSLTYRPSLTNGYFYTDVAVSCCNGRVGDANGIGGDEPTIGDVSALIDAKFISGSCTGILSCLPEADVNQSGGTNPTCDDITIGDISVLIDNLFITAKPLPNCL